MESTSRKRWCIQKVVRFGLVAVILGAIGAAALTTTGSSTASAHSTSGVPFHLGSGSRCTANSLLAGVPQYMYASSAYALRAPLPETVTWQPTLYMYTNSGWLPVTNRPAPVFQAETTPNGFMRLGPGYPIWHVGNQFYPLSFPFENLQSGYFAVRNRYTWANGVTHYEWSAWCKVG